MLEIFLNAFHGKLAEFGICRIFQSKQINIPLPNLDIYKLGKWDNYDFNINQKMLSVKSSAYYSNLLLLETKTYTEVNDKQNNLLKFDYHIFCRIFPHEQARDIYKSIHPISEKDLQQNLDPQKLKETLFRCIMKKRMLDIPGYITKSDLEEVIIKYRHIIYQNNYLNKCSDNNKMDVNNYYVLAKDLRNISTLFNQLK